MAIATSFSCKNNNRYDKPAISADTLSIPPDGDSGQAVLAKWYGLYLNTDADKLTSYKTIIQRTGWFRLSIKPDEIIFESDKRMETDFPTEAPGGIYISYKCDYQISGDTLKLYEKNEGESAAPRKLLKSNANPVLILFQNNGQYHGISEDIRLSENMTNAIRLKSGPPYLFRKFDTNDDEKYNE